MFAKSITQASTLITAALILGLVFLTPCSLPANPECAPSWQPDNSRTCCDDLFYNGLAESLTRNIQALQKTVSEPLQICEHTISTLSVINSYSHLQTYIKNHSAREISSYIDNNFKFCSPEQVLITGYYEPVTAASLTKNKQFPVPLYTAPPKEFTASRKTMETTSVLHGYEIAYVADAFTAFMIHIQGSALLTFKDGSMRQVHYQKDNNRPYTSIGRILIEQNAIKREDMSMQAIKNYISTHPEKTTSLLQTNERFIFFTLSDPVTDPNPPCGSFNIPLTPERSIALDPKIYPQGLLLHLQGTLPVIIPAAAENRQLFHRRQFSRFMLNQDSGKAITGKQRVDLFMGRGQIAEKMAGEMQENGCLRILLPK
jgi:membrane-bound lytic murein transglycosylase